MNLSKKSNTDTATLTMECLKHVLPWGADQLVVPVIADQRVVPGPMKLVSKKRARHH